MNAMRRSWFHLASGAGLGRIFGFVSNLLLSRWLGPADLGLFNLITTTVQTSDTLVRCGGDYALNFKLGGQPESTKSNPGAELARALSQLCSLATSLVCVAIGIWVWFAQGLFPLSIIPSQRIILTGLLILMIACEGMSASAWEVLLVSHRTESFALRQGLFFPLRLLFAALGSLVSSISGALLGWCFVAVLQCFWLKKVLGNLWTPLQLWPLLVKRLLDLLRRGLPFYAANLLSAMIFYPLLLKVATSSGLADLGYLRVGQILQQLFAFLPSTLVPVLFLKMRSQSNFKDQVVVMEQPLRIIWLLLVECLILYYCLDYTLVKSLFGAGFTSAITPTRLLLSTTLFECLAQLVVQPLLASGNARMYAIWQNVAAVITACLGWFWIPTGGLGAYLTVRLLYVILPLFGFGNPVLRHFNRPEKLLSLLIASFFLLFISLVQVFTDHLFVWTPFILAIAFIGNIFLHCQDLVLLPQLLRSKS